MTQTVFPGDELRERRESMGLTAAEVFRRTRIRVDHIEALERGDVDALPAPCYAAGFLKSYCEFLELDPNRFIESLRACSRPTGKRFLRSRKTNAEFRPPAWMQDLVAWAVIIAILVLGWVTYTVVFQPKPPEPTEASAVEMVVPPAHDRPEF